MGRRARPAHDRGKRIHARARARKARWGGTSSFSSRSTAERCTSRAGPLLAGELKRDRCDDPDERQARDGAEGSPPTESAVLSGPAERRRRSAAPIDEPKSSNRIAKPAAPTRATSGVYGDSDPSGSRCGATRAPMNPPAITPAAESRLIVKPEPDHRREDDDSENDPVESRHEWPFNRCCLVSGSRAPSQSSHSTAAKAGWPWQGRGGLWRRVIAGQRQACIGWRGARVLYGSRRREGLRAPKIHRRLQPGVERP